MMEQNLAAGGGSMVAHPHRPEWSDEAIARFFSWTSRNTLRQAEYFSNQVGGAVVEFLHLAGVLRGEVLDYGCGPGYLLEKMLERGVDCQGTDFSKEAVEDVNQKFAAKSNWKGAQTIRTFPTGFADASFDLVTCLETIEHLPERFFSSTLRELQRITKPGGAVLVTTPNEENLDKNMIYCPFCEAEFHRVEHVRSFSAASLRSVLEEHGYKVRFCEALTLWRFFTRPVPTKWDMNLRYLMGSWQRAKARAGDRWRPAKDPLEARLFKLLVRPGPHLVALAERV